MRFLSILALALASTGAVDRGAVTGDARPKDVAAIRAHVERIFAAYQRKDREDVRRTHAADWRGFLTGSRGVLRGIDAYMQEAEYSLGSPVRLEHWSFRDYDTVFYGDTAIVSYVADLDLKLGDEPLKETLRVIDVYRGAGADWQQVASQVARHPDAVASRLQTLSKPPPAERETLLANREAVWRAYFAGDANALGQALPEELVAMNPGEPAWTGRRDVLERSAALRAAGVKLIRLEFPRTEIQVHGDTAILYSTYVFETEAGGRRESHAGRGTEVYVRRDGQWVNSSWHLEGN